MNIDRETEDAILRMVLEESFINDIPLGFCSADGKGVLCDEYATKTLDCKHNVCDYHSYMCLNCLHVRNKAVRKIHKAFKLYIFKKRLHEIGTRRDRSATKIIGFFKIIKAKKELKKLKMNKVRENFLARFEKN